jgi:hypothetical protein
VSHLCKLFKSLGATSHIGKSPARSTFSPGAAGIANFFPPKNAPWPWMPSCTGTTANGGSMWRSSCLTMSISWLSPSPVPRAGSSISARWCTVKRFSNHEINKHRGGKGSIWQDERYDRIVRDDAEFLEKWNYIRHNPVKAGLAEHPEDYLWLYERGQGKGHR